MENISKEKNFISAVVYCYNDEQHIGEFIEGLYNSLNSNFSKFEIIVVDDSSKDNSVEIVKQYAAHKEHLAISVINMSYFQGLEHSMNAGVDLSIGDFVYEFDSVNRDYDWSLLIDVYRHVLKGHDIVAARVDQKPRMVSRLFYRTFNHYAHLQYRIGMESFRLLSRRAINRIHSISQSIPFRKAAYANCGLSMDTIVYKPICLVVRKKRSDEVGVATDSLILFTDIAFKVSFYLAILMFSLSLGFAIYALIYKLMENPVEGWATTIIFLSLGLCGIFAIMSLMLKYLQLIVKLTFKKKDFLFESIDKLQ